MQVLSQKQFLCGFFFYEHRDSWPLNASAVVAVHHNWIKGDQNKWERAIAYDTVLQDSSESLRHFVRRARSSMATMPAWQYRNPKHAGNRPARRLSADEPPPTPQQQQQQRFSHGFLNIARLGFRIQNVTMSACAGGGSRFGRPSAVSGHRAMAAAAVLSRRATMSRMAHLGRPAERQRTSRPPSGGRGGARGGSGPTWPRGVVSCGTRRARQYLAGLERQRWRLSVSVRRGAS